jgi:5-methylcytosine-specific restriction endonuclease McrA
VPYKDPEVKRASDAAYRATHREEQAAYQAAYRAAHREEQAAYQAAHYAAHREEKAVYDAAYRAAHREERLAYDAAYAAKNRDKIRDKVGRHRSRKADAFIESVDRQVVFTRDAGTCGICQQGVESANWHLDHVIPLSKGGQHSYDNVQVSHPSCNQRKSSKLPLAC